MTTLVDFQKDFLDALVQPLVGEDRAATPFGPGLASPGNPAPRERTVAQIGPSAALGAEERFALYQRQYWYRIIDSLAEDFPRTRSLLGEARFWRCVEPYLVENPPREYTLLYLGHGFADYLERTVDLDPDTRPWAAALARAEYAQLDLVSASEAAAPVDLDRIRPAPSVWYAPADPVLAALFESSESGVSGESSLTLPDRAPMPSALLVIGRERDYSMTVVNESLEFLPLLEHLSRQRSLSSFFAEHAEHVEAWSEDRVRDFFQRWNRAGWFAACDNGAGA